MKKDTFSSQRACAHWHSRTPTTCCWQMSFSNGCWTSSAYTKSPTMPGTIDFVSPHTPTNARRRGRPTKDRRPGGFLNLPHLLTNPPETLAAKCLLRIGMVSRFACIVERRANQSTPSDFEREHTQSTHRAPRYQTPGARHRFCFPNQPTSSLLQKVTRSRG